MWWGTRRARTSGTTRGDGGDTRPRGPTPTPWCSLLPPLYIGMSLFINYIGLIVLEDFLIILINVIHLHVHGIYKYVFCYNVFERNVQYVRNDCRIILFVNFKIFQVYTCLVLS